MMYSNDDDVSENDGVSERQMMFRTIDRDSYLKRNAFLASWSKVNIFDKHFGRFGHPVRLTFCLMILAGLCYNQKNR